MRKVNISQRRCRGRKDICYKVIDEVGVDSSEFSFTKMFLFDFGFFPGFVVVLCVLFLFVFAQKSTKYYIQNSNKYFEFLNKKY